MGQGVPVACAINRSRELKEMLHATGTEPYSSRFFTWRESPGGLHHATRTYLGRVENDTKTEEFMCHNCRNYLLYFFFFFFQSLARGDVCKAS